MRALIVLPALLLLSGVAYAQSPTEGPLAAPDSTPAAPVKPKSNLQKANPHKVAAHHKPPKTVHRDASDTGGAYDAGAGSKAQPIAHAPGVAGPNDPVSFGMKWNGNSDDARETRIQNYNGDSQGTGAEVGMKLHF